MVARLVALAFLPIPKKERKYINHINGVKTDNRVENLEWCTQSENQLHAIKMGLQKNAKGEQRGAVCKLKNSEVIIIKKKIKQGVMLKDIAKSFGVNPVTISNIKTKTTWAHIEG